MIATLVSDLVSLGVIFKWIKIVTLSLSWALWSWWPPPGHPCHRVNTMEQTEFGPSGAAEPALNMMEGQTLSSKNVSRLGSRKTLNIFCFVWGWIRLNDRLGMWQCDKLCCFELDANIREVWISLLIMEKAPTRTFPGWMRVECRWTGQKGWTGWLA